MDPVAHTLVGASLAETRLGRVSALSTPTLILAANAPDIDAVTMFVDRDLSLGFRRGWTHGVLALAVLPIVLTGLVLLVDRGIARRRGHPPRARPGPLLALSYLAILTHPALDWLNTYGIRLLMPFDGRWFYGDALFIIDPWVWLLAGAGVVLAHSRSGASIAGWLVLAIVSTTLIIGLPGVPPFARLAWLAGLAVIAGIRIRGVPPGQPQRVATFALACAGVYMLAMVGGSRIAVRQATAWLADRDSTPVDVMASPRPANPFVRDIVVIDASHYHFLELDWLRNEPIRVSSSAIERRPRDPIVQAALAAPHVQGIQQWLRFPAYSVNELADGYRVVIRDVRYTRSGGPGFPDTFVELDFNLQPRPRNQ